MNATIWIEPHERWEALQAYADWLSGSQKDEINEAPEDARIRLWRMDGVTQVDVFLVVNEEANRTKERP